ncbi:lebercilin [Tachyglossus aculeatus]|uniref:lebercilin n=1 Tax=Tachyglossus aculeatus TaxID=9261 RepID=UPI0018F6F6ED|nr:lebercilin [Tachyglossus aculeatus]
MGDRGRSPEGPPDRSSDGEPQSDSYFSDDFENSSAASDRSFLRTCPSPGGTGPKKEGQSQRRATPGASPGPYAVPRKSTLKCPANGRGIRPGRRAQSLGREPPPKAIDLLTRRVLSARLLRIGQLQNEATELRVKLAELQKENKALKRLQYRQEKALDRFEDTENEISQLLARHGNEAKALREQLRKSQEKERATERRVKEAECELYRTKRALQKLKKLSEARHLPERDRLARKLALAEAKLDDTERRVKEMAKNLELSNSSFQRQLHSEKRKTQSAQEENKTLKLELQRLCQKLKEKERELDVKNIYSNRLAKASPKRDHDLSPRKRAASQDTLKEELMKGEQATKAVQTGDSFPPEDFPAQPSFVSVDGTGRGNREPAYRVNKSQQEQEKPLRGEAETPRQSLKLEEKRARDPNFQAVKQKAETSHDESEREQLVRRPKAHLFLTDREARPQADPEAYPSGHGRQPGENSEEMQKELLLAKLNEIDREIQNSLSFKRSPPPLPPESESGSPEKHGKTPGLSRSPGGLPNGPLHLRGGGQQSRSLRSSDPDDPLTFGGYVPSFGRMPGRSGPSSPQSGFPDPESGGAATARREDADRSSREERKWNLMEQLFGPGVQRPGDSRAVGASGGDFEPPPGPAREKGGQDRAAGEEDDGSALRGGRSCHPNGHRLKPPNRRPSGSSEEEIEEVTLR